MVQPALAAGDRGLMAAARRACSLSRSPAIAKWLRVPVASVSPEQADSHFGFILGADIPSAVPGDGQETMNLLAWRPAGPASWQTSGEARSDYGKRSRGLGRHREPDGPGPAAVCAPWSARGMRELSENDAGPSLAEDFTRVSDAR